MPRVVPSQIVELIDQILGSSLRGPAMAAVLDLANELPNEFIVLSGNDYSNYRIGVNTVLELLDCWKTGRGNNQWIAECSASLKVIRDLLSRCPDEIPTAELSFIPDVDLRDSIRNDISAAYRALSDGLWKAATVLAGAAAEAMLHWAITAGNSSAAVEAARVAVIPGADKDPDRWSLDGYIRSRSTWDWLMRRRCSRPILRANSEI
jgi:hypothetical protein